jgi:hypothetical protein
MYVKQSECAFDGLIFLPSVMTGMRFFFSPFEISMPLYSPKT